MPDASHIALIDLGLFAAGFVTWTISTLSAGGGSMLMVAAGSTMLGAHAIAPVVTVTSMIASPTRIALFWKHIDWRVVWWYMPGAIVGAMLGAWIFTRLSAELMQLCLALFLVSTGWQYRMGNRARSFRMRLPWFVPVSFASGMTSAVLGASGIFVNPFYLNYGMVKERMVATRAVNSTFIQATKIGAYASFGALDWDLARHGLAAGAGAVLAIWVCRPWLHRMPVLRFRQLAVLIMLVTGLLVLWRLHGWLTGALTPG